MLTTKQLVALTTNQVAALSTTSIRAITTVQAASLTTAQVEALTTTQTAALTTSQIAVMDYSTPIILDLDGNGVKTLSIASGVQFDLLANGATQNTGWVSRGDGLLVLDRNHDGSINDGSELFGSSTLLANGNRASDGYVALNELDSNHDGVISSADAAFADLRVWVDGNSDGLSSAAEISTLASLNITKLDLQANENISSDNGNLIGLTSSYQTSDGVNHAAADVWFAVSLPPTPPLATDLGSKVSSLAQAIGLFDELVLNPSQLPALGMTGANAVSTAPISTSLAVSSLVEAMSRYDANGNLMTTGTTGFVSVQSAGLASAQATQLASTDFQDKLNPANGVNLVGVLGLSK